MSIKLFAQACNPLDVFGPDDPRWVEFDAARGESLCAQYALSIRRVAHDGFDLKLFAGHLGVGKSSELRRLRSMLENPREGEKPFTVVSVDADELLSVNDVAFPDLLVALAGRVQRTMIEKKVPGFGALNRYLKGVWDEIKGLLFSDVELKEVEGGAEFFKASIQFRARSTSRGEIRKAIDAASAPLIDGLNDLLGSANVAVRERLNSAGLVLIVDGLDRNFEAVRTLLFDRLDQLAQIRANAVFTVPIPLVYDAEFTKVENKLGDDLPPVSMIRLRHADGSTCTEGWAAMREFVAKRCQAAGETVEGVFDSTETRDWLIEMSGGHPRRLLIYLDSATNRLDRLPIDRATAEKAVQAYANSLVRQIPDECWEPLARLGDRAKRLPKDDLHRRMLLNLYIFEYLNGGAPWYEVNPVVRTLHEYREARKKVEEASKRSGAGA